MASDLYPHFVNIQDPLPEFHPLAQQEVMYIVCIAIITLNIVYFTCIFVSTDGIVFCNELYFSKADTVKGFTYFELATEARVWFSH